MFSVLNFICNTTHVERMIPVFFFDAVFSKVIIVKCAACNLELAGVELL